MILYTSTGVGYVMDPHGLVASSRLRLCGLQCTHTAQHTQLQAAAVLMGGSADNVLYNILGDSHLNGLSGESPGSEK